MDIYSQNQYDINNMLYLQAYQLQQQLQQAQYVWPTQVVPVQKEEKVIKNKKRGYVQWELWKREALIEKVDQEGMTIKDAAKEIGINYSTAKHIVKVYRKTGTVETKMMKKKKTKLSNTVKTKKTTEVESEQSSSSTDWPQELEYPMPIINTSNGLPQLEVDENMMELASSTSRFTNDERSAINTFFNFAEYCQTQVDN